MRFIRKGNPYRGGTPKRKASSGRTGFPGAHTFKTPLTTIQTANCGLSEVGNFNVPRRELSDLTGTESTELISLCTRLLQTAKLEPKHLRPDMDEIRVSDLVTTALNEQSGRMGDHKVEIAIDDPEITVQGDISLLSMALAQYLDNAAKYSYFGTTVKVAAKQSRSEVLISVHNFGPAIPLSDRERIFQPFYRTEGTRKIVVPDHAHPHVNRPWKRGPQSGGA